MSARGTRTLSRLFQGTMRIIPEKRSSRILETAIPVLLKDLAFEPDFSSLTEHERIWYYQTKLVFKDGEFLDMDLVNKKRRLLCAGTLFCQSDSVFERKGQIELFVLLFDNYLVMAKPVRKKPDTKLCVYKRPIPLDLLKLERYGDISTRRAKRRSSIFFGKDDGVISYLSELGAPNFTDNRRGTFPFTITHEGRLGGSYTLYADTEQIRSMWRSKLEEAIRLRQQSSRVFKMKILNRESFLVKTGVSSGYLPEGRQFTRTINSVTPFKTRDGRHLMAIGCVEGLWIGNIRDPQSFHRILPLQMIWQCAVLEESGIILILTHNDLCAYDLESCVPTSTGLKTCYLPQKLNSKSEVSFFRVGMIDGKAHVIFATRKRTDTIFRILKVVRSVEQAPAVISPGAKARWFSVYRDFLLPWDCTDAIFLRHSLIILRRGGFSIVSMEDLQRIDIPLAAERNAEHKSLIKRCTSGQSLGIFRLETEAFLLCYDKFGVYVDKHGTLVDGCVAVEWEGVAERVFYHHPYILLFSRGFVEVRHAASGHLEQIIPGNGIRCIWEGGGYQGEDQTIVQPSQDPSLIGVTNAPAGLDELAIQCIFTLVPSKFSHSRVQTRHSLSTVEHTNTRL